MKMKDFNLNANMPQEKDFFYPIVEEEQAEKMLHKLNGLEITNWNETGINTNIGNMFKE